MVSATLCVHNKRKRSVVQKKQMECERLARQRMKGVKKILYEVSGFVFLTKLHYAP